MNLIFRTNIQDFQCGYKAVDPLIVKTVLPKTTINSWFWDAELLVIASFMGYNIIELPVKWVEYKYKKTYFKRLISDIFLHGTGILYLKGEIKR